MNPDDDNWEPQTEEEAKAALEVELKKIRLLNPQLTIREALKRALNAPPIEPGESYRMPAGGESEPEEDEEPD